MLEINTKHEHVDLDNSHLSGQDLVMHEQAILIKEVHDVLKEQQLGAAIELEDEALSLLDTSGITLRIAVNNMLAAKDRNLVAALFKLAYQLAEKHEIADSIGGSLIVTEDYDGKGLA